MRRYGTFAALALGALAAHVLLLSGTLRALPVGMRLVLAFSVLVMLPGRAWLATLRVSPPGGPWLSAGWALGLGVGWLGVQIVVTRMLHLPFTVLVAWAVVPNVLLWLLPAWRESRGVTAPPAPSGLGRVATVVVLAAAVVACVHVVRVPTPVGFQTDSPDHIGTIRRMMAEGDAFPVDAFFRDAGRFGADPRKGLWHPGIATIALLAHADPLEAWWTLAALLAGLFALNAAAFAFLLGGPAAAAIGAWALVLTYGGSLATQYLREAVFATKLADQLALATLTAVLVDLDARRRSTRLVAIGLGLGAVAAHVFAALQFAVVFGALGLGLLVRERGLGLRARRLLGSAGAIALACLPYLAWRAHGAYAPSNVIHTEPQGLLTLFPGATVVSFSAVLDWVGALWIVLPFSLWAWVRSSERPAVLALLTTTLAVGVLLFCPPVVALLQPRLGYLLMRFAWLLPLPAALAFAIPALLRAAGRGALRTRALAVAGLLGLGFLLLPVTRDAARVLAHPRAARAQDSLETVLRWRDALAWMDTHLPAGSVVLSDPATSYSIPMMTRDYVATLVDQHSSPNDPQALARIMDARDALDPGMPWSRTREVVERRGVTAIALNDRFASAPRLDYWAPSPQWYHAARARLDGAPLAFERVYDTGDFVVYRVHDGVLRTLAGGGSPRSCVAPVDSAGVDAPLAHGEGVPDLQRASLDRAEVHAGDTLGVVLEWHAARLLPPASYLVTVRFDQPRVPGVNAPDWCAKPVRKAVERLRHELYRFRFDHLPVDGAYGVDLWRPTEVVRDSFAFDVPQDVAAGKYRMEVRMLRQPHYPNFRLSDFFSDRDYYSGQPVGWLRVLPARVRP